MTHRRSSGTRLLSPERLAQVAVIALLAAYTAVRTLIALRRPERAVPPPSRTTERSATAGAPVAAAPAGAAEEPDTDAEEYDEPPSPERRRFLAAVGLAAGGAGAALLSVPVVGFLLSPLLRDEPDVWRAVGALDEFRVGDTVKVTFQDPSPVAWSGPAAMTAAWLRREAEQEFVAFAVTCTHLGCAVRWETSPRFFMCPCHGGVFYEDGSVAAGPPLSPLVRYAVRVQDGQVEIRTAPLPLTGSLRPGAERP